MKTTRIASLIPVIVFLSACGPGPGETGISVHGQEFDTYDAFVQRFLQSPCDSITAPYNNEMHDCQRLVRMVAGEHEFGPLAGIIPDSAAVVQPETAYQRAPIMVAWVTNAGSLSGADEYAPLDLGGPREDADGLPAVACLWLHSSGQVWHAILTSLIRPPAWDCTPPPEAGDAGWNRLRVERQRYGDTPLEDYPNTARWQWTGVAPDFGGEHYIGVKCGAGWCSVGDSAFQPVQIPQPAEESDPQRAIPGWYDAQFLAVWERTPGNDSTLVPGPWGAVYPMAVPDSTDSRWLTGVVVAEFELEPAGGGIGAYARKLRAAPRSSVQITFYPDRPAPEPALEAMYIGGNGSAAARGIKVGHVPHGPAGSARWRWHDEDETAWVPCPRYGCCDVQEAF